MENDNKSDKLSPEDIDRIRYRKTDYIPHSQIDNIRASQDKHRDLKITLINFDVFYCSGVIKTDANGIHGSFFSID